MIDRKNAGKRVQLVKTSDPYTKLKPGAQGTLVSIRKTEFDTYVSVQWDDGSSLMLLPYEGDQFVFVTEPKPLRPPISVDLAGRRLRSDYDESRHGVFARTDYLINRTNGQGRYRFHRQDIDRVIAYINGLDDPPTATIASAIEKLTREPETPSDGRLGDHWAPAYSEYFDDLALIANHIIAEPVNAQPQEQNQ